jgi:ribosome-associated protein
VDVVVHIFKTDKREYYGIEDLWGDAEMQSYKSA